MSASPIDEILGQLPIDQLAEQFGVDPSTIGQAAATVIPSLIGGLQHNAVNGSEQAIAGALTQHTGSSLVDGSGSVDLHAVDIEDGAKIVQHIFGDQSGQLAAALGQRTGASSSLIQQLLPILAPIVLAYLAKRLTGGSSQSAGGAGGNILGDILGSVLGGGGSSVPTQQSAGGGVLGSILGSILAGGGLDSILGGGGHAGEPQTQPPAQEPVQDPQVDTSYSTSDPGTLQVDDTVVVDQGVPDQGVPDQGAPQTGGSIVDDILGSIFGKR
jgi:hypothetical protein